MCDSQFLIYSHFIAQSLFLCLRCIFVFSVASHIFSFHAASYETQIDPGVTDSPCMCDKDYNIRSLFSVHMVVVK